RKTATATESWTSTSAPDPARPRGHAPSRARPSLRSTSSRPTIRRSRAEYGLGDLNLPGEPGRVSARSLNPENGAILRVKPPGAHATRLGPLSALSAPSAVKLFVPNPPGGPIPSCCSPTPVPAARASLRDAGAAQLGLAARPRPMAGVGPA